MQQQTKAKVTYMKQSNTLKCPFAIMMPEHYNPSGSCKCFNKRHRHRVMMKQWEYTPKDFLDAGVVSKAEDV